MVRHPRVGLWRAEAPPGVQDWHPGIPLIVEAPGHRATCIRAVRQRLPEPYKHLATNYRYTFQGEPHDR